MFQKVLVGFDGSGASRKALEVALDLAGRCQAKVTAVQVVRIPDYLEVVEDVDTAVEEGEASLSEARGWLQAAAERSQLAVDVRTVVGHPAETITRLVEDEGFDLVVLGRRGLSAVQRWMLGSVSDKVVRHAPCAVLVVP
ncbi:MAG TPA: universal stress protein [Deinococcales bacterium]|nr:universal stress protein [Deinococcales bacterium]